jgi:hypothetical protein
VSSAAAKRSACAIAATIVAPIAIVFFATYFDAMRGPLIPYGILAAAWLAGIAGILSARWPRHVAAAVVLVFTLGYIPGSIVVAAAAACFLHGDCL